MGGVKRPIKDVEATEEAISNLNLMGQGEDVVFLSPVGAGILALDCLIGDRSCQAT